MSNKTCNSCNAHSIDYVSFPCPSCGTEIVRCSSCRNRNSIYTCRVCAFEGP